MWLSRLKDRALAETIRLFLNHRYKLLGKMTTLRLDTESHTIEVSADLVGETQPIDAKIGYRLEELDGRLNFVPTKVECSRPWMELLATEFLGDGTFRVPVPAGLASAVVKMLKI
jgi:hypothetical protein